MSLLVTLKQDSRFDGCGWRSSEKCELLCDQYRDQKGYFFVPLLALTAPCRRALVPGGYFLSHGVESRSGTPAVDGTCTYRSVMLPPGSTEASLRLGPDLRDSFATHGVGWGGTGPNGYPLFRIDQIWTDSRIAPRKVYAQSTEHSDHRMVICEATPQR